MKNLFHLLSVTLGTLRENRLVFAGPEQGDMLPPLVDLQGNKVEGTEIPAKVETPEEKTERLFAEAEQKGKDAIRKKANFWERMWTSGSEKRQNLVAIYEKASPADKEALRLFAAKQVIKDALSSNDNYAQFAKDYALSGTDIWAADKSAPSYEGKMKAISWLALSRMIKDFPNSDFNGMFNAVVKKGSQELVASKESREQLDTQFAQANEKEKFNLALKAGSEILGIKLASYDALKIGSVDDVEWLSDQYAKATPKQKEMLTYLYVGKVMDDISKAKPMVREQTSYEKKIGMTPDPKMVGLSVFGKKYGVDLPLAGIGGVSVERNYAYACVNKLAPNLDNATFDRLYRAYTA
ncbi:hypothetical protein JXA05_03335 [Candidatus Peregrinibacteria bacterium]|nr:hypothetical protein [Candidatus Peregrinibacteria bacterium]